MSLRLVAEIFFHDLMPVLLVIAAGWLAGRWLKIPPHPLARVSFYILNPALVYISLIRSDITGAELVRFLGFSISIPLLAGSLGLLLSLALGFSASERTALMMTAMFVNAGSYGLGVIQRAFGEAALARAVLYFMTNNILLNTLGVLMAVHTGGRTGWRSVLILPSFYAALLAAMARLSGWMLPEPVEAGIALLSRGAIPVLLLVLGLELAHIQLEDRWIAMGLGAFLRLMVIPLVAIPLATVWGLEGPARQAGLLESAMPAAISSVVMAAEFGVYPRTIAGIIFLSTLLSPLTLSLWIAWLRG
ncbi:AEC family transporter [Thermoflexus sp.]|uniref:AEC family transporter n=1 Tax=Thermoflexus sp. TaxID=1969742 RepID=UPI001755366F|nr:AEC family transporter [Thermoflexus sp.]